MILKLTSINSGKSFGEISATNIDYAKRKAYFNLNIPNYNLLKNTLPNEAVSKDKYYPISSDWEIRAGGEELNEVAGYLSQGTTPVIRIQVKSIPTSVQNQTLTKTIK
jgi:hypothetical protein